MNDHMIIPVKMTDILGEMSSIESDENGLVVKWKPTDQRLLDAIAAAEEAGSTEIDLYLSIHWDEKDPDLVVSWNDAPRYSGGIAMGDPPVDTPNG